MKYLINSILNIKYIAILFLVFGCETEPSINLSGNYATVDTDVSLVRQIEIINNSLMLASSNGFYSLDLTTNTELENYFDSPISVFDFVFISEERLLVSVKVINEDSTTILRSLDGGASWNTFRNGFGGEFESIPYNMEVDIQNTSIIYATEGGAVIAKSSNGGVSWDVKFGDWGEVGSSKFIKVDSKNSFLIWAGGSNGIFQPFLIRSQDAGETWEHFTVIKNVEANANDVIINTNNSEQVLVGLSSNVQLGKLIRKSENNGEIWKTVLSNNDVLTFTRSPRDENVIYASGINQNGTIFFTASNDFGDTWQTIEFKDGPTGIQVNDMVSVLQNGKEVLYFGTNKGLYSFTIQN